jgi:alkylation response protein AidB-like acyl-CoA dehydrogenase
MSSPIAVSREQAASHQSRLREIASRFEMCFGGEERDENALSISKTLDCDAVSAFPQSAYEALGRWGVAEYYVPAQFGGKWRATDELMLLLRLIARRDLTLAIAHAKTFLGCISVWIGGSNAQALRLAEDVKQGTVVSLGLTERAHGSDIGASETIALRTDDGYALNGEKYLINNATRCRLMSVFARTAFNGNARDFSILLVDKRALLSTAFSPTAKQQTHGIRGADISGIVFSNARIEQDALVGAEGGGMECVLKGFQITRTLCAGLSAGGADAALRRALCFAAGRYIGGRALAELPMVRGLLNEACADMLILDIMAQVGARAVNAVPEAMSVISSIVKAEVPQRAELMVDSLADVLGARAYLERGPGFGGFAKIQRDIRLVSIFDGNTVVNLQAIRFQLKGLARRRRAGLVPSGTALMRSLFDLCSPLPEFRRNALSLSSHKGDPVVAGLEEAAELLLQDTRLSETGRTRAHLRLSAWLAERDTIENEALDAPLDVRRLTPRDFDLARRYARVFAAVCCIRIFLHNKNRLAAGLEDGIWLVDVLDRLAGAPIPEETTLLGTIEMQRHNRQLFSVIPVPLADSTAPEAWLS